MKEYRFKDNPDEEVFVKQFQKRFVNPDGLSRDLSAIVYGWKNSRQDEPIEWVEEAEFTQYENLIQWLGTPVGQGFLEDCGFVKINQPE